MLNKFFFSLLLISIVFSVEAKSIKKKIKFAPISASLVIDADSKKILHSNNSRKIIYPASLTKMMTIYLAFEAMQNGKVLANEEIIVSKYAASAKPSKLGMQPGEKIKFIKAINASIVRSANDATRAIAERITGSEQKFVLLMNKKAKYLGMRNTHFNNSTGWHDPKNTSTAEDMVKLAVMLKKHFPKYYHLFSQTSFKFKGKIYPGTNKITKNYPGANGMKTGYISPSGFNLVTSATQNGKNLIAAVIGGKTSVERDNKMTMLLDKYFSVKINKNINKNNFAKNIVSRSDVASKQISKGKTKKYQLVKNA